MLGEQGRMQCCMFVCVTLADGLSPRRGWLNWFISGFMRLRMRDGFMTPVPLTNRAGIQLESCCLVGLFVLLYAVYTLIEYLWWTAPWTCHASGGQLGFQNLILQHALQRTSTRVGSVIPHGKASCRRVGWGAVQIYMLGLSHGLSHGLAPKVAWFVARPYIRLHSIGRASYIIEIPGCNNAYNCICHTAWTVDMFSPSASMCHSDCAGNYS